MEEIFCHYPQRQLPRGAHEFRCLPVRIKTINFCCLSHLVCTALFQDPSKQQRVWMGHLHPLSRSSTMLLFHQIFPCISLRISISFSIYSLDYIILAHHYIHRTMSRSGQGYLPRKSLIGRPIVRGRYGAFYPDNDVPFL